MGLPMSTYPSIRSGNRTYVSYLPSSPLISSKIRMSMWGFKVVTLVLHTMTLERDNDFYQSSHFYVVYDCCSILSWTR